MKQIPLRKKGKEPRDKNWRRREYTDEEIVEWRDQGGNIGLRLDPPDLIIDIDPKHDDAKGRDAATLEAELEREFGIDLSGFPAVTTGSGGRHVYLKKAPEIKTREKLKAFGGAIEFKGFGRQVLAPGCTHPNGNPYEIQRKGQHGECPAPLLQALKRKVSARGSEPASMSVEDMRACLDQLDVLDFRDYDRWLAVLFSCHDAGGGAQEYREAFKAWSAGDPGYVGSEGDIDYFWDSAESGRGGGRTAATLYWFVTDAGGTPPRSDSGEEFAEIIAALPEEEGYDPEWRCNSHGKIRANLSHNVVEALRVLDFDLAYDEFSHKIVNRGTKRELDDDTLADVARRISEDYGLAWTGDPSDKVLQRAAIWHATGNSTHPIREWLDGLEWDGTPRLETWLIDHAHVEDTPYSRAVSHLLLRAAVARIYHPGAKYDIMVIFEGQQGVGKSKLVKYLGGQWALEGLPPLRGANDKDVVDAMQGYWFVEIEELAAARKTDADNLKAFVSRTADRVRLAYERNSRTFPRQCVLIGTTNDATYLRDMTGGRRMAPILIDGEVDFAGLDGIRDQLFAEATVVANPWNLTLPRGVWKYAAEEAEQRLIRDPWEEALRELCFEKWKGTGFVTSESILYEAMRLAPHQQDQRHTKRLSQVMQRLGMQRIRRRVKCSPHPKWGYVMPIEENPE